MIIETTYQVVGRTSLRVDSIAETLKLLKGLDFDAWRQMGTGSAAENQLADDLRTLLIDEAKAATGHGIEL